jgi:hypothetical protein
VILGLGPDVGPGAAAAGGGGGGLRDALRIWQVSSRRLGCACAKCGLEPRSSVGT